MIAVWADARVIKSMPTKLLGILGKYPAIIIGQTKRSMSEEPVEHVHRVTRLFTITVPWTSSSHMKGCDRLKNTINWNLQEKL